MCVRTPLCSAEHRTRRTQIAEHCVHRTQAPNTPNTIKPELCSPNTGAEHAEHRTPNTPNTVFSATKEAAKRIVKREEKWEHP